MARMTKKTVARRALVEVLMARSAQLTERDRNAEIVRKSLRKDELPFCEWEKNGDLYFSGTYLAEEGVVSIIPWVMLVSEDRVVLSGIFPLRVPTSRHNNMLLFLNEINTKAKGFGMFLLETEIGCVRCQRDLSAMALRAAPEGILGNELSLTVETVMACSTDMLEVMMDADVPKSKDSDDSELCSKKDDNGKHSKGAQTGESSSTRKSSRLAAGYSLDGLGIKSDVPLDQIVAAVCRFRKTGRSSEVVPRLSILLNGPSGCGKSEFVKYLGERTGMEVVAVTASDVLRSLVGETEQRIADVFREASEKHAILFLDEVDGLLYDRKNAFYGWERIQTNELLQQMERFTGVLVCATNLVEHLDPAVMRRFTFKVQMSALDDDGKIKFFRRYFKTALTADERRRLLAIPNLTPGDFRTVRERLYFLGKKSGIDNIRRIAALEEESKAKNKSCIPIGFA